MKTMNELRANLSDLFDRLKDGSVGLKEAAELNNTAGKIVNTVRAQLEYHKLRKDKPQIDFLKCH